MNPFYFGTRERRLFGIYTPAVTQTSRRAVILCHPWGQEYLRAYRSMKQLAVRLNRADTHVLRFDYFGTGDSGGDMTDADLAGWEGDIEMAIDELKEMTQAEKLALVGLRLGANLAANVARKRADDISDVVMWDPIRSGGPYLQALRTMTGAPPLGAGQPEELLGFELSRRLVDEIAETDLAARVEGLRARSLVVLTEAAATTDGLDPAVEVEKIETACAWLEENHTGVGAIPVKVLDRIVTWLS